MRKAVERSGQPPGGTEERLAAARLDHGHGACPVDFLVDADAAAEGNEIGAATEEDVLAVIDDFVDAGMEIGTGTAAEIAAAFNEMHAETGFSEGAGGAHAGDTAANDDCGFFFGLRHRVSSVDGCAQPRLLTVAVRSSCVRLDRIAREELKNGATK
jgi:hypothetical protein